MARSPAAGAWTRPPEARAGRGGYVTGEPGAGRQWASQPGAGAPRRALTWPVRVLACPPARPRSGRAPSADPARGRSRREQRVDSRAARLRRRR